MRSGVRSRGRERRRRWTPWLLSLDLYERSVLGVES